MRVAPSGRKSSSGRGNSVSKGEGGMNWEIGIDVPCYV